MEGKRAMATSNLVTLTTFLARLLRRSDLSAAEQEAVLNLRTQARQVPAHRTVVTPGSETSHSCLVVDGLAARFDQMSDGRRQFTAVHLPGDMCDLHSVVAPIAGWGIEALTTTTVLLVPHDELRRLAATYPALALAFWRDTTADASILAKWVANLGRKDAQARLAHLLCEIAIRMEQAGLGDRVQFRLEMTQDQLADTLGLTSVHVNRTIQGLRAEGLVQIGQRSVHILDWHRLTRLAEFSTDYLLIAREPARMVA
jgi:CRP-like cAMP-binding protein